MKIRMPAGVCMVIEVLQAHGYEAYAVGGCVRDSILARTPSDWDITTSADPCQVKRLFPKTVDTGLAHGTVTVLAGGSSYEVTTYRIDGEYEDGRHPREVQFTASLKEDLNRRDFTVNAMAYSRETGLVDVFGGMDDLQHKIIRCVGDPWKRFQEDALRILRAVRFAAQLGFSIEEETKRAVRELAPTLTRISAERIQAEIVKLLTSDRPWMWKTVYETGISKIIMPEFDRMMETEQKNPHHGETVGEHTLKTLDRVENGKVLRLTMLLHDVGKPLVKTTDVDGVDHFYGHGPEGQELAKKILRRLRFDNETVRQVSMLVYWHDLQTPPREGPVRRAVHKVGEDLFPLLLKVQRADILSQSSYQQEEKLERLDGVEQVYRGILEKGQCISLKTLAVNGRDLMDQGMKPGPELGRTLESLLEAVLEQPELNEKEILLQYWKKTKKF